MESLQAECANTGVVSTPLFNRQHQSGQDSYFNTFPSWSLTLKTENFDKVPVMQNSNQVKSLKLLLVFNSMGVIFISLTLSLVWKHRSRVNRFVG